MQSSELESDNFDIALYLKQICKKHHTFLDEGGRDKYEIDFLSL